MDGPEVGLVFGRTMEQFTREEGVAHPAQEAEVEGTDMRRGVSGNTILWDLVEAFKATKFLFVTEDVVGEVVRSPGFSAIGRVMSNLLGRRR